MDKPSLSSIICDANILIDYCSVNKKILKIFSLNISTLYVPDVVLSEVSQLSEKEAQELELKILDTPLEMIETAFKIKRGTSQQDSVCYLWAKEKGWPCATNDKKLRKVCKENGIDVLWGLQFMIMLTRKRLIGSKEALRTAKKIKETNHQITDQLIESFEKNLITMKETA